MTTLHRSMRHTGISMPLTEFWPWAKAAPKNRTPMNFWPSWAPCMKLMAAAPAIWAKPKNRLVLRRSMSRQMKEMILHTTQPVPKPSTRLSTRP